MRPFRIGMAAACIVAAAAITTPAQAGGCSGAAAVPSRANAARVAHATLCLLNAQRAAHGLPKLHMNRRLHRAAAGFAHAMASRNFFSHVSPSGSTPLSRIRSVRYLDGARSWAIGENIAWGMGATASPRGTVTEWMHSPGHRANILNGAFRQVGIGIAPGAPVRVSAASRAATYATDFGSRG
jgi:uncharacterized protein YkwD